MIQLKNLKVQLQGKEILQGINLNIEKNKTTVLIGHSGSGKTTLLHTLAGFYPLSGGSIEPPVNPKETGLLIQNFKLFPWYTVQENILLAMHQLPLSQEEKKSRILTLSQNMGIQALLSSYPGRISGGEMQRAAIAQVLAKNPQILLMDEPTSSLDAFHKEKIQKLLIGIQNFYPVTKVIVTHNVEEALILGHRIAVLSKGKIQMQQDNLFAENLQAKELPEFWKQKVALDKALEVNHE